MQSWFVWKNINSRDMGLWITTLPGETRAEERATRVKVPGRSGHLTLLEGDNVYDSYVKECTVTARRDIDYDRICDWLSGSGDVVFSSNPNRAYEARIASSYTFDAISNDLCQAVIPFYCQPLKKQVPNEPDISFAANQTIYIYNPGTVPSKPFVTLEQYLAWFSIAGNVMVFECDAFSTSKDYSVGDCVMLNYVWYRFKTAHSAGDWNANEVDTITKLFVDCESETVTVYANGIYPFIGHITGDFWEIPIGTTSVTTANTGTATITPRWRWR